MNTLERRGIVAIAVINGDGVLSLQVVYKFSRYITCYRFAAYLLRMY